ncbi:MAG: glycosyltransferase [Pseudomonadota bacterium]|nr:glycosyltransferase [Pseudomonadota bacterium]
MNISICISTYQRPERLSALLTDLSRQRCLPQEVIVVDNDAAGSARGSVECARRDGAPFPILYDIEQRKNVALTRNCSVALASSDWLAFIDDDERAPRDWLAGLASAAETYEADCVLGPVEPLLPADAPNWLQRGRFYDWARMLSGTVVPLNQLRFGNVLLNAAMLRSLNPMFDPAYGLTGGEDGDVLTRLAQNGARIVWCDEATVTEPVEASRLSLRWLLLRSMRGGQDFARHTLSGRYGQITPLRRARFFLRALTQLFVAIGLSVLVLPLGRHRAAYWLTKVSANLGKLSSFGGLHYREYA